MKKTCFIITVGLVLGLFSYTAAAKWLNLQEFLFDMHNQGIPQLYVKPLGFVLLMLETFIPLALLFEKLRSTGLFISFGLFLLFTLYGILILLHVFSRVPCSCGGILKGLSWPQHVVLNLFFLLLTGWALFYQAKISYTKNMHA